MSDKIYPLFSEILNDAIGNSSKGNRRLADTLQDVMNAPMRNIQRYRIGYIVPNLETADLILRHLGIKIDKSELSQILLYSRKQAKEIKSKINGVSKASLSVDVHNIDLGIQLDQMAFQEIMRDRINELFGDTGTVKKYVEALIEKDLNEHIL